ncbi:MAG: 16S rRNA (adenine(1518)-N(6)/adenine(1519)-N(6))-dimethyltransferase RsmA [Gammaproteobacteria bacterium]|nr:16S rRNA (adenine(1518)-N(6)/adenine(1519)-N(6))-dimethyltransferase RsmA [Gammaproteobacteria bacterium]
MTGAHRPRRRFGQHFLHDPGTIARIVAAIAPRRHQLVIEIGPGEGALTEPLLALLDELHAIEIDRDLVAGLAQRFPAATGLCLHAADALDFDLGTVASATRPARLVGNLPYNISTPLIFHLLDQVTLVQDMTFMLQLEVAQRLTAVPDTRAYGRLSVMTQYHADVALLLRVAPGAFRPAPRVYSAVVRLQPRPPATPARDPALFRALVTRAFGQRRKTLRNALGRVLDPGVMVGLGIDPQRRAETLRVVDFVHLANCLSAMQTGA